MILVTLVLQISKYTERKMKRLRLVCIFLPKLCLEIKGFGQNAEEFKLHGAVHSL